MSRLRVRASCERAFTLVELLVVIAIIGTMVGLLLPAVQRSRESARRSRCANSLRQIALGTMHYEDRFRRIPGLFEPMDAMRFPTTPIVGMTTWSVIILPDIEQQAVWDANAKGQLPNIYVDTYVCPSDASKSRAGSETSYVANGGRLGPTSVERPANGVFVNRQYHSGMAVMEGHWLDGREYTAMYSENINATYYDEIGYNLYLVADTIYDDQFKGKERTYNPVFLWALDQQDRVPINADGMPRAEVDKCERVNARRFIDKTCPEDPGKAAASWARPSSYHSGGVNMAFGSGRVLFVRQNIDYGVYIAMMTMNEKHSDSPNPQYILKDADFQ